MWQYLLSSNGKLPGRYRPPTRATLPTRDCLPTRDSLPSRDRNGALRQFALLALTVATLLAQSTSEDVRRVGSRLQCKCGCPHTVASCDMFECEFSKPAKLRIAQLKEQGVSDGAIVDEYVKKYGQDIYRAEPNSFGWIVPYSSLAPGALLVWWFIKRYRKPRPLPELPGAAVDLDDPELVKYKDQIEKDLAKLE